MTRRLEHAACCFACLCMGFGLGAVVSVVVA